MNTYATVLVAAFFYLGGVFFCCFSHSYLAWLYRFIVFYSLCKVFMLCCCCFFAVWSSVPDPSNHSWFSDLTWADWSLGMHPIPNKVATDSIQSSKISLRRKGLSDRLRMLAFHSLHNINIYTHIQESIHHNN